jgi:hypothetical protein
MSLLIVILNIVSKPLVRFEITDVLGFDSLSKKIINDIDHSNGNYVSLLHWLIVVILVVTFGAFSCYIRCN